MSLTVAYGALIAGVIVWLLLVTRFRSRPWEFAAAGGELDPGQRLPSARIGLWVFLGVVTSLFALFISAFFMRMGHEAVASDWKPFPEPLILWINTAVLILGSVAMQWARSCVSKGDTERTRAALTVAAYVTAKRQRVPRAYNRHEQADRCDSHDLPPRDDAPLYARGSGPGQSMTPDAARNTDGLTWIHSTM